MSGAANKAGLKSRGTKMQMFEVIVYSIDNVVLRKSLIQASHLSASYHEAENVLRHTDGGSYYIVEG